MNEEQTRFLRLLGRPPARLNAEQVAWALGCQPHDVPVIVNARLLKPLGNPPPNSVKSFAAVEVLALAQDPRWLGKVTTALLQHWQRKNAAKKAGPVGGHVVPFGPPTAAAG